MHTPAVKKHIQRCFSKAAAHYDDVAHLQQAAGQTLVRDFIHQDSARALLDLGCGTGLTTQALLQRLRCQQVMALDLSYAMLQETKQRLSGLNPQLLQGDFEHIPLQDHAVDWIFSNMALQWTQDFSRTLQECWRVLQSQGFMALSFFIRLDTADKIDLRGNQFHSPAEILQYVKASGFRVLRAQESWHDGQFENRFALMQFFKKTGANYLQDRSTPLVLGKGQQACWQEPVGAVRFQLFYLLLSKEA